MTRRSIVAAISIFVHVVVLFAAMTADFWRPITEWPTPRRAIAFVDETVRPVRLEDIELPKPAARLLAHTSTDTSPIAASATIERAPIVAPSGVTNETGGEAAVTGGRGVRDVEGSGESSIGALGEPVTPPPPPSRVQEPIRLHSSIRAPQRIVNVTPVYPTMARDAHVQGIVIIEATIDDHGNVVRAQVLRSIPLLDEAALEAVRQWKFTPTLLNGVAVPIVMTVTVNFSLAP
jgi:protein TonB